MRLAYIVLVTIAATLAFCDRASAMSDSKHLAMPQRQVQTQFVNNRYLRVHQEAAREEEDEEDEEERTTSKLTESLSEKFFKKPAEEVSLKLTRSKSLNELSKLDDAYYIKALKGIKKAVYQRNRSPYEKIEKMGYNPDGMLLMLKEMGGLTTVEKKVLRDEYTKYWVAKYPAWTSNLAK